jgi:hypothetical protein
VTKGLCGGGTLRTSPAGTGERRLEEGHSGAVPLHGTAVPLLTNGACTPQGGEIANSSQTCYYDGCLRFVHYEERGGGGTVDAEDLKSSGQKRPCGFDSHPPY